MITELGQTSTFATSISATIGIGTPGYMPTEQGRGRPRPNSDIYALGIIGIQALIGLNPMHFEEDVDSGEILWQHRAHVSDALASVLTKMVHYHFKDRFQTVAEVSQALEYISNTHLPPVNSAPPQIPVFLSPFSQEPLPDPTIIPAVVTNRLDIPLAQATATAIYSQPLHLPTAPSVSTQPTASQIETIASDLNHDLVQAKEAPPLVKGKPKYSVPITHKQLQMGAGITCGSCKFGSWLRPLLATSSKYIEDSRAN